MGDQNWDCALRLFQCVAVASRPLHVKELAEFLAFDFEKGSTPAFQAEWRPEDPAHAVLSTCSSLLSVVDVDGCSVVQFAHFSVKEYLTSARLAETKDTISRFHVSITAAHTIVAQACLGVLLHLDENITEGGLWDFPLAEYAAEHWVDHARFENVSPKVQDGMKRLFDPRKCHLSVWVWIYDPEAYGRRSERSEHPAEARATPLHYAAVCNMHDIATFLIVERSQDVNARGFYYEETPLHVSSRYDHVEISRVLLEHGADREPRDKYNWTPLGRASIRGHMELFQILLEYGADPEARDVGRHTSLHLASSWGNPAVVRALLKHGADVKAQSKDNETPLHLAEVEKVAQILLEHGADANALNIKNRTPLHLISKHGRVGAARVLLKHGVDVNARDTNNATPLHLATSNSLGRRKEQYLDVVRLLLQHGSDVHARDDEGRTPFMRATEKEYYKIMQLLLDHGAKDHRV